MQKQILKSYIDKLKKEDIIKFINNNNYQVSDMEINTIYFYIKNYWEELFDNSEEIWKKLQNCLVRPLLTSNKKCHWNMNILMRLMLIFIFKVTNFTSLYSTLARYFVMVRMLPLKQIFLTKHFIPKDMPKLIMYNQISLK